MGISDSSRVATAIFLHHIVVLSILFVSSVVYGINHPHVFRDNMHSGTRRWTSRVPCWTATC